MLARPRLSACAHLMSSRNNFCLCHDKQHSKCMGCLTVQPRHLVRHLVSECALLQLRRHVLGACEPPPLKRSLMHQTCHQPGIDTENQCCAALGCCWLIIVLLSVVVHAGGQCGDTGAIQARAQAGAGCCQWQDECGQNRQNKGMRWTDAAQSRTSHVTYFGASGSRGQAWKACGTGVLAAIRALTQSV